MPVIIGKELVDFEGLDVQNYLQGLQYKTSSDNGPQKGINRIILHWTGGEGGVEQFLKTLENRQVGAHFFIDDQGKIYQLQDVMIRTSHALGDTWDTIGIEIQNRGILQRGDQIKSGRIKYKDLMPGAGPGAAWDTQVTLEMLTFTPAQIESAKLLCRHLCARFGVPYQVPTDFATGELRKTRFSSADELDGYNGICGHYHVDIDRREKLDPGTDLLNAILEDVLLNPDLAGVTSSEIGPAQTIIEEGAAGERIYEMTKGRQGPPLTSLPYYVLKNKGEEIGALDFNAIGASEIGSFERRGGSIGPRGMDKFVSQTMALKDATTLEMSEAVPILAIKIETSKGVVDLNKEIFNVPQLSVAHKKGIMMADRPLASLDSFKLNVQPIPTGGPTSYIFGSLSVKIHNPHRLNAKDEQGRHLVNLMKQGYHSRVKFGANHNFPDPRNNERLRMAFQTKEMDFVTSQYKFTFNDDLTMDLTIELVPSHEDNFSRIMIGENLPLTQINKEDVTKDIQDPNVKKQAEEIVAVINSYFGEVDPSLIESSDEVLMSSESGPNLAAGAPLGKGETIGQAIKGFVSNPVLEQLSLVQPTIKTNYVNALKAVQAQLLHDRVAQLLDQYCYLYTAKGKSDVIAYPAINIGALFNFLVAKEVERTVAAPKTPKLNTGESTSVDPSYGDMSPNKSVLFLYGKFNSKAGQYSNKPISTFPINADALLGYFKEQKEVGNFAGTINQFVGRMTSIIASPENYSPQPGDPFEMPNIKYTFYKDPTNKGRWIFYVYDSKEKAVEANQFLKQSKAKTAAEIKTLCLNKGIPFIEVGSEKTFIKNLSGETLASNLVMGNNFFLANSPAFSQRQMDGANIPSGISREYLFGKKVGLTRTVDYNTVVLPLKLSLNTYLILSAHLYAHVYIFFPLKELDGLYTIDSLTHEITNGSVATNMTLIIQENGIPRKL